MVPPPGRMCSRAAAFAAALLLLAPSVPGAGPAAASAPAPMPLALINASQFAGTQYLIVTAAPFAPAMQSIADWKTQKGLPAKVALIGDILQSTVGRDEAEQLHRFLQDVYFNATNQTLKYVLLGGGVGVIPGRYLLTNGSVITWYTHDFVLSDIYYAGLDTDWDANGNGLYGEYGEEDWDANVMVGRMPFNDAAQAATMRDNLLSYEQAPLVGPWMRQAVAFASVMDPPNNVNNPGDPYEYSWGEDNAIRSIWNTQPYLPPQMGLDILADYYEIVGGNYTSGQDRLNNASMVAAISGGASVVMSVTHGWVPSGRGVPEYAGADGVSYTWGQGLTYLNATGLGNVGALSAGYFSSCLVGNFSDPSLPNLARFLVQPNKGFVVMVLPSDGTLRGEDEYENQGIREGNWWQSEVFWRDFFQGDDPYRFGPALYQQIRDYDYHILNDPVRGSPSFGGYRTQKAVYNLLGDPEVPIWTDIASSFNATLPAESYTATHHFRATYRDGLGRPVAGATVSLQGPGVYVVTATDADGRIDAVLSPTATGTLTVTATKHNFLPRVVSVPVVPAPPDLSLERQDVRLGADAVPLGSTVGVTMTVRNLGQQASPGANATVEDIAPGSFPEVVGGVLPVPGLPAGAEATLTVDWTPNSEGVHTLRLTVDPEGAVAEFDELNNQVAVVVPVSSVDLALRAADLMFDPPAEVAPGGLLRVTGAVGVTGQVPRGYLIGYTLTDEEGAVVRAANVQMSTQQTSFALQVQVPQAGNFTLDIQADLEDAVLEFNESNNHVARAVRSGAGPTVYALPALELVEGRGAQALVGDLRLFVTDPDTPFEALVFRASVDLPQVTVWVDGASLFGSPAPGFSGEGRITLRASDGREAAEGTASLTVTAVNDPPIVEPLGDMEVVAGSTATFQIVASDPDGDVLTFASLTPVAQVDRTSGRVTVAPDEQLVGTHTLFFSVSDGRATVQRTGNLLVRPANHAPEVVDMGPVEVTRGQPLHYMVLARDPDGDPVTFEGQTGSIRVAPDGLIALSAQATNALAPGTYFLSVRANDTFEATQRTIVLVVSDAPPAGAPAGAAFEESASALGAAAIAVAAAGAGLGLTLGRRRPARK